MSHKPVLVTALVFVLLLGGLTLQVAIQSGPDVLVVVSFVVLIMFGLAIWGAIREPGE